MAVITSPLLGSVNITLATFTSVNNYHDNNYYYDYYGDVYDDYYYFYYYCEYTLPLETLYIGGKR